MDTNESRKDFQSDNNGQPGVTSSQVLTLLDKSQEAKNATLVHSSAQDFAQIVQSDALDRSPAAEARLSITINSETKNDG